MKKAVIRENGNPESLFFVTMPATVVFSTSRIC